MSTKSPNSVQLTMMDFSQFLLFIPQLSFLMFSRPPIDKSAYPIVAMLQELIKQFEQATRERGKNTAIYEDPDTSNFTDKELIGALEEKCNDDPNFIVPEGFRKILEKQPCFKFEVPQMAKEILGETKSIATEIMDEIVFSAIGTHFLEPLISLE